MTENLLQYREAAERVIEQTIAAASVEMGRSPSIDVAMRLQIAVLPALLRAVADEADMATSREDLAGAGIALMQCVACGLSGYFGEGPGEYRKAAALLAMAIRAMACGSEPAHEFNEKVPAPKRGGTQ